MASQVAPGVKNPLANARDIRDVGLNPGSGRSPGGGHGYPLQCSCLGNPWTEEPGRLQLLIQGVAFNFRLVNTIGLFLVLLTIICLR